MICPYCLHKKTGVYNSRSTQKINEVWRRRRCEHCGKEFTTREHTQPSSILKVKDGKKTGPFLQGKLLLSLLKACDHRADDEVIFYLIETIQQQLYVLAAKNKHIVTPQNIVQTAQAVLQHFDPIAYVKYSSLNATGTDIAKLIQQASKKPTF